jgi:septal ring factor EnvC (AmiA/AmiB activator)
MGIFNPWKEVRELKAKLAEAEKTYVKLTKQIEKLEFTNKENSREISLLEAELKATKAALVEASKNDTRDNKGRFTKAKK